jgi:hypothetical protein
MATTANGDGWVGAIATARRADARGYDPELLAAVCGAVREYLEREFRLLSEEVRRYPRPISRCDVQLTGLLEQRASAAAALQRLDAIGERALSRADGLALAGELVELLLNRR